MKMVYLDSNIFIAYYANDTSEIAKKKMVHKRMEQFAQMDRVRLCTSMWTIAEMVNVLISNKKIKPESVAEIERDLINEKRLHKVKFDLLDVCPQKDYDFTEFFYHIRDGILKYHSGVGDIIHSVIMKNYGIKMILTFDGKDDFTKIPDLVVMHP